MSFEQGKAELLSYFTESFKKTDSIIIANTPFFDSISKYDEVYVLGHSIGDVDMPYFKKVIDSVGSRKTRWFISYRGKKKECHRHL